MSDLMEAMAKAGAPMDAIIIAVRALEEKDATIHAAEQEAQDKRAAHAEWKRLNRAAKKALDSPCDVHGQSMDETENPPVLDKETLSPTPPIKEIKPSPRVGIALVRKAGGFGPPEGVAIGLWNEFCGQRKKPITESAYTAILKKLAEGAEAGWPPGDMFTRALEGCWETIFVPKEIYNGRSRQNGLGTGAQQRGSNRQQDGFLNAIRDAADSFGPGERGGMPRAAGVG